MEILKTRDQDLNYLTYTDYYKRLSLLANTMFKWTGLPEHIPERFLEKVLFSHGMCAFFEDENLGIMISRCTPDGQLNHYDEPVGYTCYSPVYSEHYDADDIVVIRNNAFSTPTAHTIRLFAKRLTEVERTIDVNINGQKTPIIVKCDEKQRLTLTNLMKKYDGNVPVIFGSKGLDLEDIKTIKTDVPFIADQLMIYKHDLWNDAMSFLGIANANTDKKERLITDEVNANNNLVELSAEVMLKQREEACKEINEKFDLDVSVELRTPTDIFTALAPAMESNVDDRFNYTYNYKGKNERSVE